MKFDLIIRNALVVDPLSRTAEVADVAVHNGRIECVCPELSADGTHEIDAKGLVLQPGVIDSHLHLSVDPRSHSMVARAGVTTAVDMSGPTDAILEQAREHGRGLNIAVLNAVLPGRNVSGNSPDEAELDRFMDASLAAGAFGVKLLGGHFPLTPDSSACMVRKADEKNVYMAWHAGTTEKGWTLRAWRRLWRSATAIRFTWRTSTRIAAGALRTFSRSAAVRRRSLRSTPKS